jgi:hypothetical protein
MGSECVLGMDDRKRVRFAEQLCEYSAACDPEKPTVLI